MDSLAIGMDADGCIEVSSVASVSDACMVVFDGFALANAFKASVPEARSMVSKSEQRSGLGRGGSSAVRRKQGTVDSEPCAEKAKALFGHLGGLGNRAIHCFKSAPGGGGKAREIGGSCGTKVMIA
jgi:hypothetical protein